MNDDTVPDWNTWPLTVEYDGRTYTKTGKMGKRFDTTTRVLEYSCKQPGVEYRVWRDIYGAVYPD